MQILQEEIWKLSQGFFFPPLNGFWDVHVSEHDDAVHELHC